MGTTAILTVRVPSGLKAALEEEAKERGLSLSEHVLNLLSGFRTGDDGGLWVRIGPSWKGAIEREAGAQMVTVQGLLARWLQLGCMGKLRGMVAHW